MAPGTTGSHLALPSNPQRTAQNVASERCLHFTGKENEAPKKKAIASDHRAIHSPEAMGIYSVARNHQKMKARCIYLLNIRQEQQKRIKKSRSRIKITMD